MNRRWLQIIGLGLLVVFLAYLIMIIMPGSETTTPGNTSTPAKTYEPRFQQEGELFMLDPDTRDTIKQIAIELAESREEISYGMMYRKTIDPETGMLFLMGAERPQSFYMKNTYVSLDIIYINDDMEVVSIQKNAQPLNERSLPSEGPASYVLEVAGGFCDKHGIAPGTLIAYQRTP